MKFRLPIIIFYIAIILLVLLSLAIAYKLVFLPSCIPTKDTPCPVIDSGSIAATAATVMGVAAAILALLGAFAVAAWWANIDERINNQVNDLYRNELTPKVEMRLEFFLREQSENFTEIFKAFSNLELGNQLLEQKKINAAIQEFQIAKKLQPDNVQVNYILGQTYRKIKLYDEAISCLKTAIAADKEFALAHFELGMAYRSQADKLYADPASKQQHDEEYERAIEYLKEAIRLLPDDEESIAALGGTYRRFGKYQDALDCYERAFKLNPDSSYALGNIALLSWHEGKLDDSRRAYIRTEQLANKRIATEISYEPFWDYYDLAMSELVLGRKEDALKNYRTAVDLTLALENFEGVLDGLSFLGEVVDKYPIEGLNDAIAIVKSGKAEMETRLAKPVSLE